MTAASALSLALPVASVNRRQAVISASAKPSNVTPALPAQAPIGIKAASPPSPLKEQAVTGLTALALTAAMVVPEMAEAAQPGLSPSLKNFLLSIISGGVVVGVIIGAVIGVANFDPVKRT
ncbi:uncharacterized protein LOC116262840 [Nymphaea colorata]|uniref:uncharacterized protein LOC116262840 n=1 Tax=Nymphaea colorata TaxID=210225 RepID=UPI00129E09FA|nr:uncharacterized protein LOC116262840 [Nymphaea colorata]